LSGTSICIPAASVFRQNAVNAHYADGLVSFIEKVVKPKTMAILYESSAFGTSGADAMEKDAQRIGVKVVLKEKYEAGSVDFKPLLSKVKAAQPDVIYMVSYVMDASLLMKQIKELQQIKELPNLVSAKGSANYEGKGSTSRETTLQTTLTARVVDVCRMGRARFGSRERMTPWWPWAYSQTAVATSLPLTRTRTLPMPPPRLARWTVSLVLPSAGGSTLTLGKSVMFWGLSR
jgi:hypothetical protein